MTVAEASLKNLIPQPRNWPEFTTTPIRVPAQLKDWVLDMIAQKVDQIRFSIGNMAPEAQTEQEWINEVCGLPVGYQTGDPLPEPIAAEVAQARSQNAAAVADFEPAITEAELEPPEYTQAWIDYQEAEPNPHGWTWRAYLAALREEAGNGDPGAKSDLERFKSNGVDIGAPLSNQQLAKLARSAKRESGNAAAIFGDAAKVTVLSVGSNRKRKKKPQTRYQRIYERYDQLQTECDQAYVALCEELNEKCLPGKNEKYHNFLEKWGARKLAGLYPSEEKFGNQQWLESHYYAIREAVCADLVATFARPNKPAECNDNRFVKVVRDGLTCWYYAALEINQQYLDGEYSE